MIHIKNYISNFCKFHNNVNQAINRLMQKIEDDRSFFLELSKLPADYVMNQKVIHLVANAMQLSNNEDVYQYFTLQDVEFIYDYLIYYYPNDLDILKDAISFNYRVMDNTEKTKKLINQFKTKILLLQEEISVIETEE